MKQLRKRYISESNSLHAFVSCVCHAAACLCNQYDNAAYRYTSTEEQQYNATVADYNTLN